MSNPLCKEISLMTLEQQKEILLTMLWSLRQRIRTVPDFKNLKVVVRASLLMLGDTDAAKKLTHVPVPENNGSLKAISDLLNITSSQEDAMALQVLKSFPDAKGEACYHINCNLIKALISEDVSFLIDRDTVLTSENELLFVPPPGVKNYFTSLLKQRLVPVTNEPVLF